MMAVAMEVEAAAVVVAVELQMRQHGPQACVRT